jgi:hypothetical protein
LTKINNNTPGLRRAFLINFVRCSCEMIFSSLQRICCRLFSRVQCT